MQQSLGAPSHSLSAAPFRNDTLCNLFSFPTQKYNKVGMFGRVSLQECRFPPVFCFFKKNKTVKHAPLLPLALGKREFVQL